ncbi:MAG: hypothetical protein KA343_02545, partial [Nitrosomonas sp.]|nr:hypothetical protein [Nitrosomonas sp.]
MKYQLTLAILGPRQELEIDKERFDSLKGARHTLIEAFALEEKYEILISNYLELEQQIVRQAVVAQVRTQSDYSEFFEFRMVFNVALVNLLTAAYPSNPTTYPHSFNNASIASGANGSNSSIRLLGQVGSLSRVSA